MTRKRLYARPTASKPSVLPVRYRSIPPNSQLDSEGEHRVTLPPSNRPLPPDTLKLVESLIQSNRPKAPKSSKSQRYFQPNPRYSKTSPHLSFASSQQYSMLLWQTASSRKNGKRKWSLAFPTLGNISQSLPAIALCPCSTPWAIL